MNVSIDSLISQRQVIVSCGTGGVGKTTLSAALALRAALQGKRTLVVTIDPAKRLATSLGVGLTNAPTDLTPRLRDAYRAARAAGLPTGDFREDFTGTVEALVPDTRQTFEEFVRELAPNPTVADRVLRNPIFQIFAKEFSGTNEYMAMERLFALHGQRKWDCIILDTPPSRNTLAFLHAPQLLAGLFEEKIIRWLVLPTNKLLSIGMRKALGVLENLTGAGFMTHLFDFASALFEVRARFTANLESIMRLLRSEAVGFLMVTSPAPGVVQEIRHFIDSVGEHGFRFDGVAINRALSGLPEAPAARASEPALQPALALLRARRERERRATGTALESIPVCARVPEFARDVHSLEDLFHVAIALG